LGISREEAVALLEKRGIREVKTDWLELARRLIGISQFVKGVAYDKAPNVVDCSTFTKYIFGTIGIWLPRFAIQQYELWPCNAVVSMRTTRPGDLVFRTSDVNFFNVLHDPDRKYGIGHVGIVSGREKVIHAVPKGVCEVPFNKFLPRVASYRGAIRLLPEPGESEFTTFKWESPFEIEGSTDILYILQADIRERTRLRT
jgi:cell wall-associated NlpC family hydrolase